MNILSRCFAMLLCCVNIVSCATAGNGKSENIVIITKYKNLVLFAEREVYGAPTLEKTYFTALSPEFYFIKNEYMNGVKINVCISRDVLPFLKDKLPSAALRRESVDWEVLVPFKSTTIYKNYKSRIKNTFSLEELIANEKSRKSR